MRNLGLMDLAFLGGLGGGFDADASAYITAVETADGQALESAVKDAINAFVVGCKADGIWSAIKGCAILCGARTLNGALVPLVGPALSNVGFIGAGTDYFRGGSSPGLQGNSSKYITTNRNANSDPLNSLHRFVYVSSRTNDTQVLIASTGDSTIGSSVIGIDTQFFLRSRNSAAQYVSNANGGLLSGSIGTNRNSSVEYDYITPSGFTGVITSASQSGDSAQINLFTSATLAARSNSRIAFFSTGTSISLPLLRARVNALVNAITAAIP